MATAASTTGRQALQTMQLVERIHHDPADARLERHGQLDRRLVVAVQHQALRRNSGLECYPQLAAGGNVEVHALPVGQAGHGFAEKRLGGVGDPVAERCHRLPTASPEMLFVVNEQRGAELSGQPQGVAPPDRQAAVIDDTVIW